MFDDMDEIVREFVVESTESLDQIDVDLVALEREPDSRDLLARIFRGVHTVKGTSGFLGLPVLEGVAHAGENLLARLRDGDLPLTGDRITLLLSTVDAIRTVLANVEAHGVEGEVQFDDLIAALEAAMVDAPTLPDPVADPEPQQSPEPPPSRTARSRKRAAAPPPAPEPAPTPAPAPAPASDPGPAEPLPVEGPSKRTAADSSVRVDVTVLDSLMRLVGELVLTRNQMSAYHGAQDASPAADGALSLGPMMQRLNTVTADLQDAVMQARMQPVDAVWSKFPRVVRDLAASCNKQVTLTMHGRDTELDRSLVEAVRDPLTHLIRNAIDHGIESPQVRTAAGKDATGTLTLRAFHKSGRVVVEVTDDGAGIDLDAVAAKAVARGLVTPEQVTRMSATEISALVFKPGFSTAAAVTHVSGRGVGMDVVKTGVEAIGGTVEITSTRGVGTTCRLTLPLTLAIAPALTVVVGGTRYAIPQAVVRELVAVDPATSGFEHVGGAPVHRLRGRLLPLVDGRVILGAPAGPGRAIVVLDVEGRTFGLVVDSVLDTEEIVVSPLGEHLAQSAVFSGSTILGDGAVALILDGAAIAAESLSRETFEDVAALDEGGAPRATTRYLVVAAAKRRVAIPLSIVTRLEEFPPNAFERLGTGAAVRYRDGVMRIADVGGTVGAGPAQNAERVPVVVLTRGGRSVGLRVDAIVDIADVEPGRAVGGQPGPGVSGGVVIGDALVELLDIAAVVASADPDFPPFPTEDIPS